MYFLVIFFFSFFYNFCFHIKFALDSCFPPLNVTSCNELDSCSTCMDPGRCLWCESTNTCLPVDTYVVNYSYGQCREYVQSKLACSSITLLLFFTENK